MAKKGMNVTLRTDATYRRMEKQFPHLAKKVTRDVIGDLLVKGVKFSKRHAPVFTGDLKKSLQSTKNKGGLGGTIFATVPYATSVHEGGIPQPQAYRSYDDRRSLRLWVNKKLGLADGHMYAVAHNIGRNLRRGGIRRPTRYLKLAVEDLESKLLVARLTRKSLNKHIKKMQA